MFSIALLVLIVVLVAVLVALVSATKRSAAARSAGIPGVASDESAFRFTYWAACVGVVIFAVGAVVAAVAPFVQSSLGVTFPVEPFWPKLPEGASVEGMTATMVSGGLTEVTAKVTGLGLPARITLAVSEALWWLVSGSIAALIAVGCKQLRAGKPFAPAVTRMVMLTAIIVGVGGSIALTVGDISASITAHEVLQWSGGAYTPPTGTAVTSDFDLDDYIPTVTTSVRIIGWPLGAGLGFAALAAAFRYGARMQRDQEGLV